MHSPGALNKELFLQKFEWWRLFSAMLLHAGILRIFLNGIALAFGGRMLERVLGAAWFGAVFAACGIAGGLFWLAFHEYNSVAIAFMNLSANLRKPANRGFVTQ
jgi:rhomboid protease GluP